MKEDHTTTGPLQEALRAVAGVLERRHVGYALTGGLALAQHGVVRATQDVDLLLSIPQVTLPGLLDDLLAEGCAFDKNLVMREWLQHHIAQLTWRGVRIDWLAPVLPAFHDVLKGAIAQRLAGMTVRVASAEGLILLKLIAFRDQDKLDVQGILAANAGKLKIAFVKKRLAQSFKPDNPRFAWFEDALQKFGR